MIRAFIVSFALVSLTGCASTGVVPTGPNSYMIGKTSAGCGFRSADGTTAKLYRQANAYCSAQGKQILTLDVTARDGIPFARCASARLQFKCLAPDDPELVKAAHSAPIRAPE